MKKNVYAVSGMKCVHCKANVENVLKALNGVVSAEANLEDATPLSAFKTFSTFALQCTHFIPLTA